MLTPRKPVPHLRLPLVGGGDYDLAGDMPDRFSLVAFYRGLHCPICATYLRELDRLTEEFAQRGVKTVAVSTDGAERAGEMREKVKAEGLRFAHSLPIEEARKWGLYVSSGRGRTAAGVDEPEEFAEPGLFLVRPDGTLYFASVQSMPFARPSFKDMLGALDFVIEKNYPARGELEAA